MMHFIIKKIEKKTELFNRKMHDLFICLSNELCLLACLSSGVMPFIMIFSCHYFCIAFSISLYFLQTCVIVPSLFPFLLNKSQYHLPVYILVLLLYSLFHTLHIFFFHLILHHSYYIRCLNKLLLL